MKKIVVFGATGDIGRYFIQYFIEHNKDKEVEIVAVGSRKTDYFKSLGILYYQMDITKQKEFEKLPKDIFAAVDLAGIMPARMKGYNPYLYIDVNIIGNLNILEYCRKSGADRILFSQSFGDIKEYGETNILLKTDLPRKFSFQPDHTIYVMSKNFAVDMLENYYQMYGLKKFVFRLPTIYLYSPIDYYYVDGKIKKIGYRLLIDKAIAGEDIEIWGDECRVKDMVYVKDFCQMLYKAIFINRDCGYYNVGTGIGTSLLDQIKGIIEVFGESKKKSKLINRPDMPNAPQYIMDIEPARKDLGYEPKYLYIEMLKDLKKEMQVWQNKFGGGELLKPFWNYSIVGSISQAEQIVILNIEDREEILKILKSCEEVFSKLIKEMNTTILYEKICSYAIVLAAIVKKEYAGYIAFYANDKESKRAFITMIGVSLRFQGKGIGTELLKQACAISKAKGMKWIALEVRNKNKKAISIYTKCGFQDWDIRKSGKEKFMIKELQGEY